MPHTQSKARELLSQNKYVLLDGATGTELEKRGVNVNDSLWSGIAILSHPQTLQDLHLEYLRAGADIIISASYQLSKQAILERGWNPDEIYQKSIDLCYNAQQIHLKETGIHSSIASSIGPYGALLCDGSEFDGKYRGATDDQIRDYHEARLNFMFNDPRVDIIAFETIPKLQEIKVLTQMINKLNANSKHPKDYFFASTCNDDYELADGSNWDDVLQYLNDNADDHLIAVGANCCKLLNTSKIISKIDSALNKASRLLANNVKIIIYPNSGEVYDGHTKKWHIDSHLKTPNLGLEMYRKAREWIQFSNVAIVGGCCRTSSDDTKILKSLIDELSETNN
ncbi:unnamed protein product [Ambrosiozyma monospora]|uniref:Unnamed protein product n=1 Tax=Ambrosiozyma monospora TaxID=43982 RepID=A0ACB5SSR9_AMBMO|nr:unnamed protein product [Ambrosiozyma monospora]